MPQTFAGNGTESQRTEKVDEVYAGKISPKSSGKRVFTATVYDHDGNVISSDTQEMTAKAGLWQKIVAFFKKIFGLTKTIPEAFKDIL